MNYRLGILTTHPVQYQVPWFRALADAGVDLTVYYCQIPDSRQQGDGFGVSFQWDIPLLDGYTYKVLPNVARVPSLTRFNGCDTPGINEVVRSGRFDVFVVNGWVVRSCLQLLVACRMHGVPCVVRGESNSLRQRPWATRFLHRVLLSQYAAVLAIGRRSQEFYLANGVPSHRIFSTPYCVDNAHFSGAADRFRQERQERRARWGIAQEACVFLFSGKLIAKKRPLDIIEGLARCIAGGVSAKQVHLLVVGDGDLMAECRSLSGRRGVPVSFTGFLNQSEIPCAYACSDCLVLPSDDGETWGLVVNEAMACGLPAIVSDHVGCQADLVEEGVTGSVFPVGDVDALGRAMTGMMGNREMRENMGANAKERVGCYSYARVVEGTLEALTYLTKKTSRRKSKT